MCIILCMCTNIHAHVNQVKDKTETVEEFIEQLQDSELKGEYIIIIIFIISFIIIDIIVNSIIIVVII